MGAVALGLHGLRTDLEGIVSRGLGAAALEAKKEMAAVGRRAAGGDGKLSGVGRNGARLGAGYSFVRGSRGMTVAVYANGPWQLVEWGRSGGYRIPKRRGTGPNKARRSAPRLHLRDGSWITGPTRGGRVGGRRYWTTAYPAVMDEMGEAVARGVLKALEGW